MEAKLFASHVYSKQRAVKDLDAKLKRLVKTAPQSSFTQPGECFGSALLSLNKNYLKENLPGPNEVKVEVNNDDQSQGAVNQREACYMFTDDLNDDSYREGAKLIFDLDNGGRALLQRSSNSWTLTYNQDQKIENIVSKFVTDERLYVIAKSKTSEDFDVFLLSDKIPESSEKKIVAKQLQQIKSYENCWIEYGSGSVWHMREGALYRNDRKLFSKKSEVPQSIAVVGDHIAVTYENDHRLYHIKTGRRSFLGFESSTVKPFIREHCRVKKVKNLDKKYILVWANTAVQGHYLIWLTRGRYSSSGPAELLIPELMKTQGSITERIASKEPDVVMLYWESLEETADDEDGYEDGFYEDY